MAHAGVARCPPTAGGAEKGQGPKAPQAPVLNFWKKKMAVGLAPDPRIYLCHILNHRACDEPFPWHCCWGVGSLKGRNGLPLVGKRCATRWHRPPNGTIRGGWRCTVSSASSESARSEPGMTVGTGPIGLALALNGLIIKKISVLAPVDYEGFVWLKVW